MKIHRTGIVGLAVCICLYSALLPLPIYAALPLWEAGIGVFYITLPDYPGSDQQKYYLIPFPYFQYRGNKLRIDRKGVRGLLFQSEKAYLDISIDGGVPVDNKNEARKGMSSLDPTIQIGPSLEFILRENKQAHSNVKFMLPVRSILASDFRSIHAEGWLIHPQLGWGGRFSLLKHYWGMNIGVGPMFANSKYSNYYYSVAPQYATSTRPAYHADSGYIGSRMNLTFSTRYRDIWIGGFTRVDLIKHSVFENSPLVNSRYGITAGIGIAWIFAKSKSLEE